MPVQKEVSLRGKGPNSQFSENLFGSTGEKAAGGAVTESHLHLEGTAP